MGGPEAATERYRSTWPGVSAPQVFLPGDRRTGEASESLRSVRGWLLACVFLRAGISLDPSNQILTP
jgi:hypothetical protein